MFKNVHAHGFRLHVSCPSGFPLPVLCLLWGVEMAVSFAYPATVLKCSGERTRAWPLVSRVAASLGWLPTRAWLTLVRAHFQPY